MSLFGSLQIAGNTLQAMQIGLQVVGNNIANANTPGFIREEVIYSPAPVQEIGGLTLGLGVQIDGIVQKADAFLNERLRNASGDRAGADIQNEAYQDLESLIGELSSGDLSTSLSNFFNSIADVAQNLGEDAASFRNLAIGRGETLAADIGRLYERSETLREEFDTRIVASADQINDLTETIRLLNLRISTIEGGTASVTQAGGLRTERDNALAELAQLVDVTVNEQPSGGVTVSVNGEFLVSEGTRREIEVFETQDAQGRDVSALRYADNNSPLSPAAGEVNGLLAARDDIIGSFQEQLDEFAATLAFEFNKLYSQGQGQVGFQTLTSADAVTSTTAALDAAGLPFTPTSGSFQVLLKREGDTIAAPHDIFVNLDG
ncbi:MAG: flagellar hook-associated protein FlgK, partial [Planctomycetota bacterium]